MRRTGVQYYSFITSQGMDKILYNLSTRKDTKLSYVGPSSTVTNTNGDLAGLNDGLCNLASDLSRKIKYTGNRGSSYEGSAFCGTSSNNVNEEGCGSFQQQHYQSLQNTEVYRVRSRPDILEQLLEWTIQSTGNVTT